jgi:hypothetical protein
MRGGGRDRGMGREGEGEGSRKGRGEVQGISGGEVEPWRGGARRRSSKTETEYKFSPFQAFLSYRRRRRIEGCPALLHLHRPGSPAPSAAVA